MCEAQSQCTEGVYKLRQDEQESDAEKKRGKRGEEVSEDSVCVCVCGCWQRPQNIQNALNCLRDAD